jgi:hypothetical protein
MRKAILLMFVATLSVVMLSSCKKEEGPRGPAGPAGAAGAAGSNGNANVKTYTYDVLSSQWINHTIYRILMLECPAITQDILDHGAILVYRINGVEHNQLPYTYHMNANYASTYVPTAFLGEIEIKRMDSDLMTPATPGDCTIKIVVIEGTPGMDLEDVDFSNYEAVKEYYQLEE